MCAHASQELRALSSIRDGQTQVTDISAQTMDVEPLEGTDITALLPDETRDETSGA